MAQLPKIIVIVGPTASGKSSLGVELALRYGGEVISADSRQVYTGLDIGTGKVTIEEMKGVRHHMLDVADPALTGHEAFSADDFVRLGRVAIADIFARDKLPIIVGGTGYYVDALLGHIALPQVPPNEALRDELEDKSVEELFLQLQTQDPARAATIEPHHKRRLIRALEIAEALGSSPSKVPDEATYDILWLGRDVEIETLKQNIHARLVERMQLGMQGEARRLYHEGLALERMRELGLEYRTLADMIEHGLSEEEAIEILDREIRRYAKRQMRWFKRNKEINWVTTEEEAVEVVKTFLTTDGRIA